MSLRSEKECREILQKVLSYSKADEAEANFNGGTSGNIRYARNSVSTSGIVRNESLVVQSSFGKKTGTATINEFDDASLQKVVRRSEELAQLAPENPEYVGFLGPQKYLESNTYFDSTANITPDYRAQAAAASITRSKAKDLTAAGFLQDNAGYQAMMNTKGLFAYNQATGVNFTVTVRTADGKGSGWVTRDYNDVSKLDTGMASQFAIDKAVMSQEAKAVEPGKYTVILEPAASIGLLQNMIGSFGARQADEGRSFLAKKGGGNKLGEKIVDERVNLYSDPTNPEVPSQTWAGDGQPRKKSIGLKMAWCKICFTRAIGRRKRVLSRCHSHRTASWKVVLLPSTT